MLVLIVALVSGCGMAADLVLGASEPGIDEVIDDDVRIWTQRRTKMPRGTDALVAGRFGYDTQHRCAYLYGQGGDTRYPVVWPTGTRITSTDPVILDLPGVERPLTIGDEVKGGGGFGEPRSGWLQVPSPCFGEIGDGGPEIAHFNEREVLDVRPR